jgi:hypothetical protein
MAEELVRKRALKGAGKEPGLVLIPNPLSEGIAKTLPLLATLKFSPLYFLPSLLTGTVLALVLVILIILWPYGWIAVISHFLWGFVGTAVEQIRQAQTYAEKMPFTVALGIYFLIWLPVGTLCLPLLLIGLIGQLFVEFFAEGKGGTVRVEAGLQKAHEGPPNKRDRVGNPARRGSEPPIEKLIICRPSGALTGEEYKLDVISIEWLRKREIRVEFLNHNNTSKVLHAYFNAPDSFFVDELGYQYNCISSEISHGRDIPPGLAIRYAMFFSAPSKPPKRISFQLFGNPGVDQGRKWSLPTIECNWQLEQGSGRNTPN